MQIVLNGTLTNFLAVNPHQKQTLLILHGWSQSSLHWQIILDNLPSTVTGIALDLPAFGSTQPLPGNPGVPEYSDFVKNFIKKQKLKNVVLLGHSFGGQIAVDFSLRYPKLISHLILVSPACIRDQKPNQKSQIAKKLKPFINALSPKIYDYIFSLIASKNYLNSTPIQRVVLNKILYQDYSKKLQDITVDTAIIWGDKDVTIENKSKFLAETIPHSHLYVIYGANHSAQISAPQKFISLLNHLLKMYAD